MSLYERLQKVIQTPYSNTIFKYHIQISLNKLLKKIRPVSHEENSYKTHTDSNWVDHKNEDLV